MSSRCRDRKMRSYSRLLIALSLTKLSLGGRFGDYYSSRIAEDLKVWGSSRQERRNPSFGLPRGGSMSAMTETSSVGAEQWTEAPLQSAVGSAAYYHNPSNSGGTVVFKPPKINLERISLALRLTGEWNRRLVDGVTGRSQQDDVPSLQSQQVLQNQPPRGGSHPVNVHPSRSWHPPIKTENGEALEEKLTIFHSKSPRNPGHSQPRGASRWGPELLPYLEQVVSLLGINKDSDDGVEVALAMIYLDRACSVETPRNNEIPPCPFCTPRTVHRLSLAALLIATQTVRGGTLEQYYEKLQSLDVAVDELQQMVQWMIAALGEAGMLVTVEQMMDWSQTWDAIFSPKTNV